MFLLVFWGLTVNNVKQHSYQILNLLTNRNIAFFSSVPICEQKTKDFARSATLCNGCPAHRNVQIFPESGIITMDSRFLLMQLFRQEGASPLTILYNCVTSRTKSRCLLEDQPSSRRTGQIWSNFLALVKSRAAKFCTSCSL